MPLNFGVFTALFPVTYLWQAEIYMHGSGVHAKEHFLKHRCAATPHRRWRLALSASRQRELSSSLAAQSILFSRDSRVKSMAWLMPLLWWVGRRWLGCTQR